MIVLVLGAGGQVGQAISFVSSRYPQIDFKFATSNIADLTNTEQLFKVFGHFKPDYCINTAAYTAVEKAESESELCYQINSTGVENLASICEIFNVVLIHISTDYVFDGEKNEPYIETDATNPQNVYGKSKLGGEIAIRERLSNYYIIRTSWLFSPFGNNFMKSIIKLASARETIKIVNDQFGSPTNAIDLAEAIMSVILSRSTEYGIYHFSNEGVTTWYDFAAQIIKKNNISVDLISIPTSEYPTAAKRPKYSVLDKSKIKTNLNLSIKYWDEF